VVAVFLEVIQGEGGINQTRADYLRGLRALCDRRTGC
jgi:acetylornithine/N-succinyldiaminopimelate aminotransferase